MKEAFVGQLVKLRPIVNRPKVAFAALRRRYPTAAQVDNLPHTKHRRRP